MNPYQITSVDAYNRAAEEFEMRKRQRMMEEQKSALEAQQLQKQIEQGISSNDPAAIREWKIYSQLPEDQKQRYLQMKRADQLMNLGGQIAVRSPMGGIQEAFQVTPKPEKMPAFQAEQESAKAEAKRQADAEKELIERQASYPRLEQVTSQLRDLSKEATYSLPKQALDWAAAQSGYGATEGAKARSQYKSIIDNEILPLLRQTFGAQFTEKEGESLKATLGDVNKTPEEKQAVLDSFIAAKAGYIETLKRQLGQPSDGITIDSNPPPEQPMDKYSQGEAAFNAKKKKVVRFKDLPND